MENYIVILLYATIIILFPFCVYALSKRDLFFTRINSGDIKFSMRGSSLIEIMHDIKGKKLIKEGVSEGEFEDGDEKESFFNKYIGIWWIGIPPFSSIHSFKIKKEKENPTGDTPDTWTTDGKEVTVSSLRYAFPRPFVFKAVELKDRTTIDLMVVCKFEVVNPYKLVFIFKGDFFDNAGSMLSAKINDKVSTFENISAFIAQEKSEGSSFVSDLKDPKGKFNEELKNLIGLKLVGINISKYDPSDKNVLKATNEEAIAKLEASAKIEKAKGEAEKIRIETEANAKSIERIGQAQGTKIKEVVASLASSLGDRNVVATSAANILKAEQIAQSKVTTWVEGTAQTVVPVGGGQK